MSDPTQGEFPDGLESVTARLRASRAEADPIQLDQMKQRVIARVSSRHRRPSMMKHRLATLFTVLGLLGGTSGAIAIAGGDGHGNDGGHGGASSGEYKEGKGCGDKNHEHAREDQCKGEHGGGADHGGGGDKDGGHEGGNGHGGEQDGGD
jgi:hypothetical protein